MTTLTAAPSTAATIQYSFHAVHSHWSGPLLCYTGGRFAGGRAGPNGRWSLSDDGQRLTLHWDHWGTEILESADDGYRNGRTHLLFSNALHLGFWGGFNPAKTTIASLRDSFLSVSSAWGDSRPTRDTDLAFSGENVSLEHDGVKFQWRQKARTGTASWFLGIPNIDHPNALHVPLFYFDWAARPPQNVCTNKRFAISFVARNTVSGNLTRRRLQLAIHLSRWFPVVVPKQLRRHFPTGAKVEGYDVPNKSEFLEQFQFNLCFENTSANGYLTEKLFDSLWTGAIPLYAGDSEASTYVDPGGYIDCLHLSNEEVAEKVSALANSDYQAYINEKRMSLCRLSLEEMTARISAFLQGVVADPAIKSRTAHSAELLRSENLHCLEIQ